MESNFLLPNKCKFIGWIMFIPSFILGVLWLCNIRADIQAPVFAVWSSSSEIFTVIQKNIYNEIVCSALLISLIMIAFAKEKNEDEYIQKIRLDSLVWALYINFIALFISELFVFKEAFTTVMIINMFTLLILFVIRFNIRHC
jgi:hypothetical protein